MVPVDRAERTRRIRLRPSRRTKSPVSRCRSCTSAGTFVFRLAGRERQQSASYYTPEVLTRFVVSQALEELLDQDGERHDRRARSSI